MTSVRFCPASFKKDSGPTIVRYASPDPAGQERVSRELDVMTARCNRATGGTVVVPADDAIMVSTGR